MTGISGKQFRAVFLAALMCLWVFAGTMAFAGGAAAETSGTDTTLIEGDDQSLIDGSANQSLDRVAIQDDLGGALGGGETTLVLPDGVTVNESQSDITPFTNSSTLEVTGNSVSADGSEITVTHTGNSQADEVLRVRNIVVDVAPDTVNTDGASLDLTAETQAGTETYSGAFSNVYKPTLDATTEDVPLGAAGHTLDGNADDLAIDTGDPSLDGQIGNQTTVTLFANESNGLTWDTSIDAASVVDTGNSGVDVDTDGIEVNANTITIPVESEAGQGAGQIVFDETVLAANTTADATTDSNVLLSATVEPVEATGDVSVIKSAKIDITSPATTVDASSGTTNQDLSVAKTQQTFGQVDVNLGNDEVAGNTNVTLVLNNSDVTFDTSASTDVGSTSDGEADDTLVDDVEINENNITATFNGTSGAPSNASDVIQFGDNTGISLNVSENAEPGDVEFAAQFSAGADSPTLEVADSTNVITLNEPSAAFGANEELAVDNDGSQGVSVANVDLTDNAADADQIVDSENATISLPENTGVTFDQRSNIVGSSDIDDATVTDTEIEISFTDGAPTTIENLNLNLTADADAAVVPSATVYTGDVNYTVEFDDQINVTQATVDTVNNDVISDSSPDVGQESTGTVEAINGSLTDGTQGTAFGGADISLNLTSQPDNTDFQTTDVLNTTSVTTAEDGKADFNFSADTTGNYEITASSAEDETVNATFAFTVNSGEITNVQAEGEENALRGGANNNNDNLRTGVYKVNVTDNEGNLATTNEDFNFRILVSGQTSELIGVSNDLAANGEGGSATAFQAPDGSGPTGPFDSLSNSENTFTYNPNTDTVEKGTFYVYVGNDLAEDIDVEIVPRGDFTDVSPNTGTTTFYSSVDSVEFEVDSTAPTDTNVTATATALTADGDQIAVPRIGGGSAGDSNVFSTDDSNVVEIVDQNDTVATGVATANLSTGSAGTANLTADLLGQTDSTEVTVEDLSANFTVELVDGPTQITQNESFSATVSVTNAGDVAGTQDITYVLEDDNGDSTGIEATESGVELDAGNSTEVTFNVSADATADLATGNYTHVFASDDDELTVDAEVIAEGADPFTEPLPNAGANASAPTDPDGDGLYDDVNGDGQADFDDAVALAFADTDNLSQAQIDALDFDGDGDVDFDDAVELAFSV